MLGGGGQIVKVFNYLVGIIGCAEKNEKQEIPEPYQCEIASLIGLMQRILPIVICFIANHSIFNCIFNISHY